jgi:hypothetical protein
MPLRVWATPVNPIDADGIRWQLGQANALEHWKKAVSCYMPSNGPWNDTGGNPLMSQIS